MRAIKSNRSNKKILLITALIIAVVLTSGIVYAISSNVFDSSEQSNKPTQEQVEEQTKTEVDDKQEFIDSTKDEDLPGTNPPAPTSSDSITITTTVDSGMVTVNTKLSGFNSGSCELTIVNGSRSIVKNADVIYQPEFSTCAGFSILKNELNNGSWSLSLKVTEGSTTITKNSTVSVE